MIEIIDKFIIEIFKLIFNQQIAAILFYFYFMFYFILLIFIFYIYFFEKNKFKRIAIFLIIGFISIYTLKYIVKRERPESFIKKKDYSFPSSHAYFSIILLLFSPSNLFGTFLKFYSILTIFSLIYIPLHYLSDIIFSILLYFLINFLLQDKILKKLESLMKETIMKVIQKRRK